jgi:mono/diheme cytochrome c family protein
MHRRAKIFIAICFAAAASVVVGGCGSQGIQIAKSSPYHHGAQLFLDHCSGCHTLAVVGSAGSATNLIGRLRTNGPNFNFRKETITQALYAIRNGGFSGAIMPENIVVGADAQAVAQFLAKYSGLEAPKIPTANIPAANQ